MRGDPKPRTILEALEQFDTELRRMRDAFLEAVYPAFKPILDALAKLGPAPCPQTQAPDPQRKEAPQMTDYRYDDADGDRLTIQPRGTTKQAHVAAPDGAFIPKAEAPSAALALLSSAGWNAGHAGPVPAAMRLLDNQIRHVRQLAALKEQQARVDGQRVDEEALALLNAATGENYASLSSVGTIADFWRRAARKARELHSK